MGKLQSDLAMVLEKHNLTYCKSCGKLFDRNDIHYHVANYDGTNRSVVEIVCSDCLFHAYECVSWYPTVNTLRQAINILDEELSAN